MNSPHNKSVDQELNEREKFILGHIIENFVSNATPVSSKLIAKTSELRLSSASIRNVMYNLEQRGYIDQPHTSAGRTPTDKGYRFYVDRLMSSGSLTRRVKRQIVDGMERMSQDVGVVLEAASDTLASISNQLGVVLAPRFYQGVFERMELVPIARKRILAVLSIKSGLVKTITMELENDISRDKLDETARVINERLHGLTLQEIKETVDARLRDVANGDASFVDLVVASSKFLFDVSPAMDLHIKGATNIMTQPEFQHQDKIREISGLLDDREILVHILNQPEAGNEDEDEVEEAASHIRITIGEENTEDFIQHCSLITASYNVGDISGKIGVLGPTRMDYSRIVTLVDYMGKALSETLTGKGITN